MPTNDDHGHGPMSYEHAYHLLDSLRKLVLSPKTLTKRLHLQKGSEVLELGPGPGYFSPEIARNIPAGKLVLVEIQQEMLDTAKKRIKKQGTTNVEYIHSNAVSLPLPNESFDVVFLVAALGEVPDQTQCLRELYRILRPQGLLSITEQPGDPDFIPMSELQHSVEEEGFRFAETYWREKNYTMNFRKPDKTNSLDA